jgi:hypothetical protein
MKWHCLDIEEALAVTGSDTCGLSDEIVLQKQAEFGFNVLEEKKKKPGWLH